GVRFLPSKSYGMEAPILLGSGCVAWIACLAALFRLCFFPRLTIWVTSLGFCAAELLPPHPRFYSMFSGVTNWSTSAQPSRIRSRVHNSGYSTDIFDCCHDSLRPIHHIWRFRFRTPQPGRFRNTRQGDLDERYGGGIPMEESAYPGFLGCER